MLKLKLSRKRKVLLVIIAVILVKLIIALTALPKRSIDYVAMYNDFSKPAGFTEENNAAKYYHSAFDLYVEMPQALRETDIGSSFTLYRSNLFTELDPNSVIMMEEWLISNSQAFDHLRQAAQLPYYWTKKKSADDNLWGIMLDDLSGFRDLSRALIWNAHLNASKGNFTAASEDILTSYNIAMHFCRPNLLIMEQLVGLRLKEDTAKAGLGLLSYTKPKLDELKYLQEALQAIIDNDSYLIGLEAEKLGIYDTMQFLFLDWVRGIGRPAFRLMFLFRCMCGEHNKYMWINSFVGPTRAKVTKQVNRVFDIYEEIKDKTPWQIKNQHSTQIEQIEKIYDSNFFMEMFIPSFKGSFGKYHEEKAQTNSLITVLAISIFRAEKKRLPQTLDELVSTGYMKTITQDPFSNGPLVYEVADDNFKLYSVGKDFEDNNGEPIVYEKPKETPTDFFGHPLMKTSLRKAYYEGKQKMDRFKLYKDIVYWPVDKTY